jgi:hypothetical protein
MNIDEYITETEKFDTDEAVARLRKYLASWKADDADVYELEDSVERLFGNNWIESEDTHNHLYKLWSNFRAEAIQIIGGMTMNEKLYWFGLFDRYDACASESDKTAMYTKLAASM